MKHNARQLRKMRKSKSGTTHKFEPKGCSREDEEYFEKYVQDRLGLFNPFTSKRTSVMNIPPSPEKAKVIPRLMKQLSPDV